ncbi:MAG: NAD-dependent epimerase/dehydratase family protein [Anaerolineae bacterium]|nr:NAD-dependent epimerase/dehydratase family protein [Anaerolineae bacterium]
MSSSSSVYDPFAEKIRVSEDFSYGIHYLNAYSETKMLAEKIIINDNRTNKVILRPRAIYGEGDTTLLPRLLRLHKGRFMLGIGDGNNEISITYICNFCHAVERVTQHDFDCEIFNITDTETLTQRELLAKLAELMAWDCKPLFMPRQVPESIAKTGQFLGNHLGFRPQLYPPMPCINSLILLHSI